MKDSRYRISVLVQRPQDTAPADIVATDPATGKQCAWVLTDAHKYILEQTLTAPNGTIFLVQVEVLPGD